MKVSRIKIERMNENNVGGKVRLQGVEFIKVTEFQVFENVVERKR